MLHGAILLATLLAGSSGLAASDSETLVLSQAESSGIDGRAPDKTFPNATTLDAVHRSVLLRFPGAARQIKTFLDRGLQIENAVIELTYAGYEVIPVGYIARNNLGQKKWRENPPTWHVVARPLRQPWIADANLGPTFNGNIRAAGVWQTAGARDAASDRFPIELGPAELSLRTPEARLDITSLLRGGVLAPGVGERLRLFEDNGLVLSKLERYDSRYRDPSDSYEWAMPTGGHGLTFANPRLTITFAAPTGLPPADTSIAIAEPPDVASLARALRDQAPHRLQVEATEGETLRKRAKALLEAKPSWMSQAQFARVRELAAVGGDTLSSWLVDLAAGDRKKYDRYMLELWLTPPRYWKGWGIQDDLILLYALKDFVPKHIEQHLHDYWTSWLMPDIATDELFHPQSKQAYAYAQTSGDWRGRTSFFRAGYNHVVSTQNFNHTAAMGALLGGRLLNAPAAMADGRNGLEQLLLPYWAFNDGSSQEVLDHYYLSITLSAQKMFADFGPTAFDRLAGRIMLERTMEMLATLYHPRLRRMVGPSGRARLPGVLVEQDGIYGALHALSWEGVLKYLDKPADAKVHGMPVWGYDFPPGRVALQSLSGPWAPAWFSRIIDEKSFPFEELSAETIRSNFNPPLWRTIYLGRHYGLASQDIKGGAFDVLAQWSRAEGPSQTMEDLGTMTLRTCVNACDMATTRGGALPATGSVFTFQHKNRAIVFTKPPTERADIEKAAGAGGLASLASAVALWNFAPDKAWRFYVDGRPVAASELPLRLKASQVLTIEDGPAFVGIRPLPATDLGRGGNEIVVAVGGHGGKVEPSNAPVEPALTITSYAMYAEAPQRFDALDWETINGRTYGGFAIELGDADQYGSFAKFNTTLMSAKLETTWSEADRSLHVSYASRDGTMEARFATDVALIASHFPIPPGTQTRAIQDRRVNGRSPLLPAGLERDTSWSQQGTTGRLDKNGAVLETAPNHKAYLIADRGARGVLAYNPMVEPTPWRLTLPDGASIVVDGKVGLLRVAVDRDANTVEIDQAPRDAEQAAILAKTITLAGFAKDTVVTLNGHPAKGETRIDPATDRSTHIVPLGPPP